LSRVQGLIAHVESICGMHLSFLISLLIVLGGLKKKSEPPLSQAVYSYPEGEYIRLCSLFPVGYLRFEDEIECLVIHPLLD
jgi:hypothetical protein